MVAIYLKRCACGQAPKLEVVRVAEDAMETWVQCKCGARTQEIEDAYADYDTAAWQWNRGDRSVTPAEPNAGVGAISDHGNLPPDEHENPHTQGDGE